MITIINNLLYIIFVFKRENFNNVIWRVYFKELNFFDVIVNVFLMDNCLIIDLIEVIFNIF